MVVFTVSSDNGAAARVSADAPVPTCSTTMDVPGTNVGVTEGVPEGDAVPDGVTVEAGVVEGVAVASGVSEGVDVTAGEWVSDDVAV